MVARGLAARLGGVVVGGRGCGDWWLGWWQLEGLLLVTGGW